MEFNSRKLCKWTVKKECQNELREEKTLEESLERSSEKAFWGEGFWKGTLPDNELSKWILKKISRKKFKKKTAKEMKLKIWKWIVEMELHTNFKTEFSKGTLFEILEENFAK